MSVREMGGGDLFDSCDGEGMFYDFSLAQQLHFLQDVACGLQQMHEVNIPHGDIKPENILFATDYSSAYVTDFGGCVPIENGDERPSALTYDYTTVNDLYLEGEDYFKADVFAFGKTAIQALVGNGVEGIASFQDIMNRGSGRGFHYNEMNFVDGVDHSELYSMLEMAGVSDSLSKMLVSAVSMDPASRPTLNDVINTLSQEELKLSEKL